MAVANQKEDTCFLCNLLPFRKTNKSVIEDPRETASKTNSLVSAITEAEDYEKTNMDFANADYRGFIFAIHPDHGYMLLHCTRKKKKPNHFQVPGGHIDNHEFKAAAQHTQDPLQQLLLAGRMGAAREFFEETSIDLRNSLERLQPTKLYSKERKDKLSNEYKNRLFYSVMLTDNDFPTAEMLSVSGAAFLQKAMGVNPPNLKVSRRDTGV
jgi:8-oxo-dGTP pyrophosphatase MutT (NUDIX family)